MPIPSIPAHIEPFFAQELSRARQLAHAGAKHATPERIEACFAEQTGYLLRMSWLGRFDKIDRGLVPALDWITRAGLGLDEAAYPGAQPLAIQFKGQDHEALCLAAIRVAYQACYPSNPSSSATSASGTHAGSKLRRFFGM
jgi:hypothetical protein